MLLGLSDLKIGEGCVLVVVVVVVGCVCVGVCVRAWRGEGFA